MKSDISATDAFPVRFNEWVLFTDDQERSEQHFALNSASEAVSTSFAWFDSFREGKRQRK